MSAYYQSGSSQQLRGSPQQPFQQQQQQYGYYGSNPGLTTSSVGNMATNSIYSPAQPAPASLRTGGGNTSIAPGPGVSPAPNSANLAPYSNTPLPADKFSLVVVGSGGVGKSAITLSFVKHQFIEVYDPTIEDCYSKTVTIDNRNCALEITDTAGQEEYRGLWGDSVMRLGHGFICVYSITKRNSLEELIAIRNQIERAKEDNPYGIIIVGNKLDLAHEREVSAEEGRMFAESVGAMFMESSAKERINIDETFTALVRQVRRKMHEARSRPFQNLDPAMVPVDETHDPNSGSGSGCCVIL
ncbi:ras-domain-containing protein [Ramicandelaber brevisporus]|nr:ras-domain-containing protein [Ramicandelaber brevisporus]